jgi:crotonobetainyl-CoA:carnitine CoA-transferase CaiB-like acyl-CoA transferase
MTGEVMNRNGSRDQFVAPSTLFEASDGHVFISAGSDALFARFCRAIGQPQLGEDPRFASVSARMENGDAVEAAVADWAREHTVAEIATRLEDSGIPFGPVHTVPEIVEHPQIRAREMLIEVEHPELGPITVPGVTAKLSESPGSVRMPPPMIGEHTAAVLAERCGVTGSELAELRERGVI